MWLRGRQGRVSYLAPVLDKGLAGEEEEPRELSTVMGLGRAAGCAERPWW